ncbi:MAG: carbamoyltransferase HypF [Verrucomicrobiia bacterium]
MVPGAPNPANRKDPRARVQVLVRGAVQGVGFRPFIYRLARELGLTGWVANSAAGVVIEADAERSRLEAFVQRLQEEKPPHSVLRTVECEWLDAFGYDRFEIRPSEQTATKTTLVLPDIATCPDCLREILEPGNRRFNYPFTNCTNCGPRFTIIERLPYDRANTSMKAFTMCPECQSEYDDPGDRRFHAQPNACPRCGPKLQLWNREGKLLEAGDHALGATAAAIRDGAIVAVKGLGGFHLMAAAHDSESIGRLRRLKHREEKPFALMYPSLDQLRLDCRVSESEAQLLRSPHAPIVLLRRNTSAQGPTPGLSPLVAPGNPNLGVMLPCTPLHHLLMRFLGFPIVATSGNLAEEPICIDERDALARLGSIADLFLVHDRPIVRHADDSIVRLMAGTEVVLRRARGYAPLPVAVPETGNNAATECVLAVGAHLKNSVALSIGSEVFISQHIGDLETPEAYRAFENVIADLTRFYEAVPERLAADLHPDYLSTRFAHRAGPPVLGVQHHYAHVLSCMAEHGLSEDVLGVSWDGTGLGTDGTIWGGEFLSITESSFERVAHLRTFRLPGGEKAVKEPRRTALGLLRELQDDAALDRRGSPALRAFSPEELGVLRRMLHQGIKAPLTSSAGRLFDGVAALVGLRQRSAFEGQAAMDLEFAAEGFESGEAYPLPVRDGENGGAAIVDWGPMLIGVMEDVQKGLPPGLISTKFHNSLVRAIVEVAGRAGSKNIVLSGGCFQNKRLLEGTAASLERAGFFPFWNRQVPPNDGGIALGQVLAVRRARSKKD